MPPLPRITGREVVRALGKLGWVVVVRKGSHAQLKRPDGKKRSRCTSPACALTESQFLKGSEHLSCWRHGRGLMSPHWQPHRSCRPESPGSNKSAIQGLTVSQGPEASLCADPARRRTRR